MPSNKQYVMKKCSGFSKSQNISILQFLHEIGVKICSASDGSRINLDKLSATQIASLKNRVEELDIPIETKYQIEYCNDRAPT